MYIYIYIVLIPDYPGSIREDKGYVRQWFYVSKESAALNFAETSEHVYQNTR